MSVCLSSMWCGVCVCRLDVGVRCHLLSFLTLWDRLSFWTWYSPFQLDWLANETPHSPVSSPPVLRLQMYIKAAFYMAAMVLAQVFMLAQPHQAISPAPPTFLIPYPGSWANSKFRVNSPAVSLTRLWSFRHTCWVASQCGDVPSASSSATQMRAILQNACACSVSGSQSWNTRHTRLCFI